MGAFTMIVLFAATFSAGHTLAKPVAYDFNDIEERWAQGHSEIQIHNGQTHRDMTPAWPLVRPHPAADEDDAAALAAGGFTYATDERTMANNRHRQRQQRGQNRASEVHLQLQVQPRQGMRRWNGDLGGSLGSDRHSRDDETLGLLAQARTFVAEHVLPERLREGFAGVRGFEVGIGVDDAVEDDVPVLKPRRGHRFTFRA